MSEGKGKVNVYYLKNADAEEMADVLTEITSKVRPTKEPKEGIEFAGEVIITPVNPPILSLSRPLPRTTRCCEGSSKSWISDACQPDNPRLPYIVCAFS
jgi:hypothetical protein